MNLNQDAPRRPALRYYGGGWTRAPWTIGFIPEHDNYLEPCFGAGSILLRKPIAQNEVVNDADGRTVNFFEQVRRMVLQNDDTLLQMINLTPWAEDEMRRCAEVSPDPLEDARRFFLLCWATVYGGPTGQYYSFRYQKSVENRFTSPPQDAIGRDDLLVTAERLKNVTIMNRDALGLIEKFIREYAVIYFDPPYLAEKRRRKQGYNHEPDRAWHIEAAKLLRQSNGPVLVAGYRSKLYTELYEDHGFVRMERVQQTNGKTKAVECLWLSPITLAWLERDEENKRKQAAALAEERRQSLPLLAGIWEDA